MKAHELRGAFDTYGVMMNAYKVSVGNTRIPGKGHMKYIAVDG
jgi:hypothetical protein